MDVRDNEEINFGVIEDAKHIPLPEIPNRLESLKKEKQYVLVCRSGVRSMRAAAFMDEKGFKVANLAGGMMAWNGEVIF
ncbi:rhodanese-like domain-containing protein [Virgibacillus flavescens]|uniref:rhodanese-like domain-containing protein n=1 Tax=Virgibacillus flavescens TaxID=1611422 RepID=UPI003D350732